jgi:hypothetical protein
MKNGPFQARFILLNSALILSFARGSLSYKW